MSKLISGNALKNMGLVTAGLGLIVILVMTFPVWKSLIPDKTLKDLQRQEVARLEGEVKSLQKRVDERRRAVESASQTAKREVDRITGQISSARSEADKQKLEIGLWEARNRLATAEFIEQGLREELEGQDGLVSSEGNLRAAEAAQKTNQWQQAKTLLEQTRVAYLKLKEIPDQLQAAIKDQRSKLLEPLNGKWSSAGDCQNAPTWSVKDPSISIFWPKVGVFEEKVIDVSEDSAIVMVISPEKYKGRLYRYQINGSTLDLSEVHSGRREVLKRCS